MSLARLSAGAGYRYLLQNIGAGDVARAAGEPLVGYYAASGNPPGRWLGSGLNGLSGAAAVPVLAPGAVVTEEAMAALYGTGHNPVTGEQLGRPYPVYKTTAQRISEAVAGLPTTLSAPGREAAVAGIEARVAATPNRHAVAGYDLTFTVPKSASVLWALGDKNVRADVVGAHRQAIAAVVELIEDRFLFTRTGTNSCMQVATRGLIAAAFDHYDTRTGDPNLHTHLVIANKVQGPDGIWRSVDAQVLYRSAVALSEVYDDLFADALAALLPVSWAHRDRGPRRTAGFEIDGINDELLAAFSSRAAQVGTELDDMVAEFTAAHGREPSRVQMLRLRQQATLATRPDKEIRPLPELRRSWRATAHALTGTSPDVTVAAAVTGRRRPPVPAAGIAEMLASAVLTDIQVRRSTWTKANLLAEAARATRHLRLPTPKARLELLDQVVDHAVAACLPLDPPALFHTPARLRRVDATSVFDRTDAAVFTTTAVLDAEARLLAALDETNAPVIPSTLLDALNRQMPGQRLAADQHAAITGIATSARRLDVLVGPAGTGKTRTLATLTNLWQRAHGSGSVIGLAPSAAAAFELALALRIPCETTSKWLHDHNQQSPPPRAATTTETLSSRPPLRPGTLVIIDEASLAATSHLDAVRGHVQRAGAKLLLVGDHHQLGAVEAGGAFALLAETTTERGTVNALHALWRFRHRWEADATRALRTGDPAILDTYATQGRLHEGDTDAVAEDAYRAWQADNAAGRTSLLLAQDRNTVKVLNMRARTDRLAGGQVHGTEATLHDGTSCAPGDWITTRQNDRRIPIPGGGYIRNGAGWTITAVYPDGSIDATPRTDENTAQRPTGAGARSREHLPRPVRLPARYVAYHVELGYASTIHRAQGATIDTAHTIVTASMNRQALYVAMSRGREANHAYIRTDRSWDTEDHQKHDRELNARQIMENVLASDGAELSATATLRDRQNAAWSPGHLRAVRETIAADPASGEETRRALDEINALLAARKSLTSRTAASYGGLEPQRAHIRGDGRTITPGG
ncbi:MAG TPA: MobF family relaxase [Sporichthyaceae bacterium]|nr:MobF family relaxase [Sporichthyaceae bacterium]